MRRVGPDLLWHAVGLAVAAGVVALLLPWINADPPRHLTFSNAPYTDEGLYNEAGRNLIVFGSFGDYGLFHHLTNGVYTVATALLFALFGPNIVVARALSVASVAAIALLAVWGLARPLGRPAAALVAACTAGSQLMLLYGQVGIVEPFETALLVAAYVAMARSVAAGRWQLAALSGLLLAAAVGTKASALLAAPAILGVPLLAALGRPGRRSGRRPDRGRLGVALAGPAVLAAAALIWGLAVAIPHWSDLKTATATLNGLTNYPRSASQALTRLRDWLHSNGSDHAYEWSRPLLVAAVLGAFGAAVSWRGTSPVRRQAAVTGLVWAALSWCMPVLGSYTPNRYLIVAVPGLAILAGAGVGNVLDRLRLPAPSPSGGTASSGAAGAGLRTAVRPALVVGVVAVLVAPGIAGYLAMKQPVRGTHQLRTAQELVTRSLPDGAVLYGLYGPQLAFSSRAKTVVPWASARVHVDDPVGRFGVDYLIVDVSPARTAADEAGLRAVSPSRRLSREDMLLTVRWGPHELALYRVLPRPPAPDVGSASDIAPRIAPRGRQTGRGGAR